MDTGGVVKCVTIVIPCYNGGEHLDEAVQSALAQTYPNIEIVIVDDGSTDQATLDLLRGHKWPRTRVFHQKNSGPASARNLAISEALGEYILPLDSDDRIELTYVEKAVQVLEANPGVGIVYCRALKFGAENGPWTLPPYTLRELVIDNVIFVSSLFRKDDWKCVGGFNESLRSGIEDYDFWVKIVALGREVFQLNEYLFHYRVGHVSRTSKFIEDRAGVAKTYADIFRSNIDFFSRNAEFLFEHRFGIYDELLLYRERYGRVNAFIERYPLAKCFACRIARFAGFLADSRPAAWLRFFLSGLGK